MTPSAASGGRRSASMPLEPTPSRPRRSGVRATRQGWRWVQHGTVLSEILREPGPTHSVFDVLAAACLLRPGVRDVALLGFGGGSVVAALRALASPARVHAVDLDATGWNLVGGPGGRWLRPCDWHQGDAEAWLRGARHRFDVIIEDLSVPAEGEVWKPEATWHTLPALIARRLRPKGLAVLNLLRPARGSWREGIDAVMRPFRHGVMIGLRDFENRIVVAGSSAPGVREAGRALRGTLKRLGSRQARRITVARWATPGPGPGEP